MLIFCGFDLELVVQAVLARRCGPSLCLATDVTGSPWLIVQVQDDPDRQAWLCAQVSERAAGAVLEGRTEPSHALRHSATGTVDLVTVDHGRAVPDRRLVSWQIGKYLPPSDSDWMALTA
jgi:hypothetical protein